MVPHFVTMLQEIGGISQADASKVFAYYKKHKIVKLDPHIGRYEVVHGEFLDRDVILRAISAA